MKDLISKELLTEVIGVEIRKINNSILDGNLYYYKTFVKCKSKINIYELANRCKEWAINKGYEIKSSKPIVLNDEGRQVFNYWWAAWLFKFDGGCESPKQILLPSFIGENEPKAIFKACQWILDNKESK